MDHGKNSKAALRFPAVSRARIDFLKVQVILAGTYCRLAEQGNDEHLARYMLRARQAHGNVLNFMYSLRMSNDELRRIQEGVQEVSLMLEPLQARLDLSTKAVPVLASVT